jgi:pilus assembly protein CpaE
MTEQPTIHLALAEPDRKVAVAVAQAISTEPGFELIAGAADARALLGAIGERAVDVLVVDIAGAGLEPPVLIRDVLARRAGACVIVTGEGTTPATVARMLAAGATTFLPKPYRPDELVSTVREILGAPARAVIPERGARARRGSVLAVYSPKGGVGTTTIATSLAVALAARPNTRVGIIDLDLQFGDVGVVLDLKGQSGIADLLAGGQALDEALVTEVFARHSSGVHALLAPQEPTDMGSIEVATVMRLIEQMRSVFDYVVIDLWSSLEELALATLRVADRVILVTTPEVPSLRHLRRIMNATGPLLSADRTLIVANRAPSKVGLSMSEVERALGMPVAAQIPSDGVGVTKAINEGMSMMDPRANVRVARAFRDLADTITKGLGQKREAAVGVANALIAS